jgi:hypothetical protein
MLLQATVGFYAGIATCAAKPLHPQTCNLLPLAQTLFGSWHTMTIARNEQEQLRQAIELRKLWQTAIVSFSSKSTTIHYAVYYLEDMRVLDIQQFIAIHMVS